ncbi:MAG: aminoacetone oxidase family FAD-binding enzyme, partial [Planctomycetota bacterium]
TDARGIVEAFGKQGRFLHSALASLSPDDVIALFHTESVRTKVEANGKVFPVSDKAADVLAALMRRLRQSGCHLALDEAVESVERVAEGFRVTTSTRRLHAQRLIVTTGGKSYPGSGTTGDGYPWMESLGHTVVTPRPALTPITTDIAWVRKLKGVTVPEVGAAVRASAQRLEADRGSLLFTHFGVSGPTPLNLSRVISGHADPRTLELELDFLPGLSMPELTDRLAPGKKSVLRILTEALPRRLASEILQLANVDAERRTAELPRADRGRLLEQLKSTRIPISGTRGFKKAEVTAGGVALEEVDSRSMQSKLVPDLFIAGELLDLDGPIGGYNFQAAFSTGWLAASNA